MSPDMADFLRVLLGLGGAVTAGTWHALPGHHSTKRALLERGYVEGHLLHAIKPSKYATPGTGTTLYFRQDGAHSVARVYFVTNGGARALAEYLADPAGTAGEDAVAVGRERATPQFVAQRAGTSDASADRANG